MIPVPDVEQPVAPQPDTGPDLPPVPPAARSVPGRDRSVQRVLRVATWGQTLTQDPGDGSPARLVYELAVRPGELDHALGVAESWRRFAHPSLHALDHVSVAQPAGSPGPVLRLERPMPRGTPLAQVIERTAVDERALAALFLDLAKALQELHAEALFVGQLAAETLLVCPPGADDAAPLLAVDAGLATLVLTAAGTLGPVSAAAHAQLFGARATVAPEVIAGQRPSAAADVFALAATLAHAALRRPLFAAAAPSALRDAMAAGPTPADVAALHAAVPQLAPVILSGVAAHPWARSGVLPELIDRLQAVCGELPTVVAAERTVLAPWQAGSPLIALAAYATSLPWSAQFAEPTLGAAPPLPAQSLAGQHKLRAALEQLERERLASHRQAETAGRNLLTRLIVLALFALIAAAIAATFARQNRRHQRELSPERAADTLPPPPLLPEPQSRTWYVKPQRAPLPSR